MNVERFERKAGSEVHLSKDDPTMLLFGAVKPEWINVPEETGYGGRYACTHMLSKPCPIHGDHNATWFILDGPVACVECDKFYWIKYRTCDCGSGNQSWWEYDAQGIELCRVCEVCKQEKLAKYRPEILTGYDQSDVDEPIEPEE